MNKVYSKLTQQYQLSKTLRFELKPVGETADYIEDFKSEYLKQVVAEDVQRSEDYKKAKLLIDDYHRYYINKNLAFNVDTHFISDQDLEEAYAHHERIRLESKNITYKERWSTEQDDLRKKLVKYFKQNKDLFGKELIKTILPNWLESKGELKQYEKLIKSFVNFTTYFSGFYENRKNLYTDKEQSTAIAYRLINENLPKFFANIYAYDKIKSEHSDLYRKILSTISPELITKLNVRHLDQVFAPAYFKQLFTQTGIDTFQQVIGGNTLEDGTKVQGINELINLHGQQITATIVQSSDEDKASLKLQLRKVKSCKMIELYKQILSDKESTSFVLDAFDNDEQMLNALQNYIETVSLKKEGSLLNHIKKSIAELKNANLDQVYIKTDKLTEISQAIFNDYSIISSVHNQYIENELPPSKTGKVTTSLLTKRKKLAEQPISIEHLDNLIINYINELPDEVKMQSPYKEMEQKQQPISNYLHQIIDNKWQDLELDNKSANIDYLLTLTSLSKDRQPPCSDKPKGGKGFQQVATIKALLDAYMEVIHVIKPLYLVAGRKPIDMADIDMSFYADFAKYYRSLELETINLYSKVRNHLSKKLYEANKVKINFSKPTLLKGWDVNKETDNNSIILRRGSQYYLGIMTQEHNKLFNYVPTINDIDSPKKLTEKQNLYDEIISAEKEKSYEKVKYKLLPGASKMLPKVFFSDKRINFFKPSKEILDIINKSSHTKGGTPKKGFEKAEFNINDCHKVINFFKQSINKHPEWRTYNFVFSDTALYKDSSDFYRELEGQSYKIEYDYIKEEYINEAVIQGKLHLFEIYSKDFSPYSKGKPNLQTLYWKGLFEEQNLSNVILKLNGEAEMFYRKHSIQQKDTKAHPARQSIDNKNANNPKKESTFDYEIVKDKRYTKDKFFLHVPITLNFKQQEAKIFNNQVNELLSNSAHTNIIAIDRGERNLLSYVIINQKGEIIDKGSLNTIATDQGYNVDYQDKLHQREKDRDAARKSWSTIEGIKELKSGYLSHVIHKLAQLIIEYDAIVCLEDLNFGFKRGRFKVEKQVYQKFEKALIDKLNYLVFKDASYGEAGHYLNAYQLTAPFESFEKLGKQSGILYYVPAAYTSKICPATGFVNFLDLKYKSLGRSIEFFERIQKFSYNADHHRFELEFDYKEMGSLAMRVPEKLNKTKWVLGTHGNLRYRNVRGTNGHWESQAINSTEVIADLLLEMQIIANDKQDLRQSIIEFLNGNTNNRSTFCKKLFAQLFTAFSLRQSKTGTDEDFILSPVVLADGSWFDSREPHHNYPSDADENGAYHIALKGLLNLEKIKRHKWNEDKPKKLELKITNEEWYNYALRMAKN